MRKLILSATMMAMMVAATAVPAFAQINTGDVTDNSVNAGDSDIQGGDVFANKSIVQQAQNFFNVSGNVVQQEQDQDLTAIQIAVASASGGDAEVTQIAVNSAEQSGISIEDVEQSIAQAIAVSR